MSAVTVVEVRGALATSLETTHASPVVSRLASSHLNLKVSRLASSHLNHRLEGLL